MSSGSFVFGEVVFEPNPRQQGLKPDCRIVPDFEFGVFEPNPRQQGLKHNCIGDDGIKVWGL